MYDGRQFASNGPLTRRSHAEAGRLAPTQMGSAPHEYEERASGM